MQMPQNFNFADSGKLWGEKELARNQFLIWRMLHIVKQLYFSIDINCIVERYLAKFQ